MEAIAQSVVGLTTCVNLLSGTLAILNCCLKRLYVLAVLLVAACIASWTMDSGLTTSLTFCLSAFLWHNWVVLRRFTRRQMAVGSLLIILWTLVVELLMLVFLEEERQIWRRTTAAIQIALVGCSIYDVSWQHRDDRRYQVEQHGRFWRAGFCLALLGQLILALGTHSDLDIRVCISLSLTATALVSFVPRAQSIWEAIWYPVLLIGSADNSVQSFSVPRLRHSYLTPAVQTALERAMDQSKREPDRLPGFKLLVANRAESHVTPTAFRSWIHTQSMVRSLRDLGVWDSDLTLAELDLARLAVPWTTPHASVFWTDVQNAIDKYAMTAVEPQHAEQFATALRTLSPTRFREIEVGAMELTYSILDHLWLDVSDIVGEKKRMLAGRLLHWLRCLEQALTFLPTCSNSRTTVMTCRQEMHKCMMLYGTTTYNLPLQQTIQRHSEWLVTDCYTPYMDRAFAVPRLQNGIELQPAGCTTVEQFIIQVLSWTERDSGANERSLFLETDAWIKFMQTQCAAVYPYLRLQNQKGQWMLLTHFNAKYPHYNDRTVMQPGLVHCRMLVNALALAAVRTTLGLSPAVALALFQTLAEERLLPRKMSGLLFAGPPALEDTLGGGHTETKFPGVVRTLVTELYTVSNSRDLSRLAVLGELFDTVLGHPTEMDRLLIALVQIIESCEEMIATRFPFLMAISGKTLRHTAQSTWNAYKQDLILNPPTSAYFSPADHDKATQRLQIVYWGCSLLLYSFLCWCSAKNVALVSSRMAILNELDTMCSHAPIHDQDDAKHEFSNGNNESDDELGKSLFRQCLVLFS
jgi:hypothetical protein